MMESPHAIRQLGSGVLNLCYVACGRQDAVYAGVAGNWHISVIVAHVGTNLYFIGEGWFPWDYCAGQLIVTEAGGVMRTVQGDGFHVYSKSVLAASSWSLSEEIVNALRPLVTANSTIKE
jgi:fructose-1,6-bisphosphatase/inositol monophosphatase family enzyme